MGREHVCRSVCFDTHRTPTRQQPLALMLVGLLGPEIRDPNTSMQRTQTNCFSYSSQSTVELFHQTAFSTTTMTRLSAKTWPAPCKASGRRTSIRIVCQDGLAALGLWRGPPVPVPPALSRGTLASPACCPVTTHPELGTNPAIGLPPPSWTTPTAQSKGSQGWCQWVCQSISGLDLPTFSTRPGAAALSPPAHTLPAHMLPPFLF